MNPSDMLTPARMESHLNMIQSMAAGFLPCGSRITCNPPPIDTDEDYLVLLDHGVRDEVIAPDADGWKIGGSVWLAAHGESAFRSYVLGSVNLIVTNDPDFFDKFSAATLAAQRLNLLDKADRIALFRAVLYAERCEPRDITGPGGITWDEAMAPYPATMAKRRLSRDPARVTS